MRADVPSGPIAGRGRKKDESVVSSERSGALVPDGWSGDLRDMTWSCWSEDDGAAATVVVIGHLAHGWLNLRYVHDDRMRRMVGLRLRALAARTPPLGVIWPRELAALCALSEQETGC
jgi:hypothetical protein